MTVSNTQEISQSVQKSRQTAFLNLAIPLLVALVHGLIYLLIMPPWQHYDEPNHFEIAWWLANHGRYPNQDESDPILNRSVVESMVENNFYAHMGFLPDPDQVEQRMPGISQVEEPPLYYYLAFLPLKMTANQSVEKQLYAVRLVSLLLFLLTILAGWGTGRELFPPGHPLCWLLPMSLALTPAFVDIMVAVNNDAAAIAVGSFFIWGSVRILQRGVSTENLIWVISSAILAYFTKSTAYFAILLLPFVLLFSLIRAQWRKFAGWLILLVFLAGIPVAIRWGDAANWHRTTRQPAATQQDSNQAVLGKSILVLSGRYPNPQNWLAEVSQAIPEQAIAQIRGNRVTLGVWMWASQPVQANLPWIMADSFQPLKHIVELGTEPVFFAYQLDIPSDATRIWIALKPSLKSENNVTFFYDAALLVMDGRPLNEIPRFTSSDGLRGEWGGAPFINLIRNPSFEKAGPRVYPPLDHLGARLLPDDTLPSMLVSALIDWEANGYFYRLSGRLLVERFWAVFGWAHILLDQPVVYKWLSALTLIGVVGALLFLYRKRNNHEWEIVFLITLSLLVVWSFALVRGTAFIFSPRLYYTVARHAYPVMIPSMLILLLGWREIMLLLVRALIILVKPYTAQQPVPAFFQTAIARSIGLGILVTLLLALDIYSICSILSYYA